MSYDLAVFDPQIVPGDRKSFLSWFGQQTRWDGSQTYDNPDSTTPALRAWFLEMIREFPAMNGPYADDDVDNPKMTDYSIGPSLVYAAFAWSQEEAAFKAVFQAAEKHRVGFFDVSGENGGVWIPHSSGKYVLVHGG